MFSIRKRKQNGQNLVNIERKQIHPEIENYMEIHLDKMDKDISKIIYQKLMEKSTNL